MYTKRCRRAVALQDANDRNVYGSRSERPAERPWRLTGHLLREDCHLPFRPPGSSARHTLTFAALRPPARENTHLQTNAPLLRRLVLGNLSINFILVCSIVGPTIGEIFCAQGWIGAGNLRLVHSEISTLDKKPDRNTCAYNTRFTSLDPRYTLNAGIYAANVASNPMQLLRSLNCCPVGNQLSHNLQRCRCT